MTLHTTCVRSGAIPGEPVRSTSTPIYQTATFGQSDCRAQDEFDYSRSGNPTRRVLEQQLAELERGCHALAFTSGMAAIDAVVRLVPPGGTIIAGTDLYGGSHRLLTKIASAEGREIRLVDLQDKCSVDAALQSPDSLLLIETPTNPRLRVIDVSSIAAVAHRRGALVAVDNTMLSPVLQQPLELGADLVIHSATKHLGGHGDVTAGAVVTRDSRLHDRLKFIQNATGNALAPFESWLLLRGIKTLAIRVERAQANALRIARWLLDVEGVSAVHYPGLESHPGSDVHGRQATGGGTVISFETGSVERSDRIVNALQGFPITVSFGGVQSTVSLPCRMSHASIPDAERAALALPPDLVRLSIGIEDPDDLIADLERAVRSSFPARPKILANSG